ncbi:hypothetical protein FHL04_03725 [Lactobacillus salsicarnum]|nr:hypothetical protein [Companilactobacillus mishanensis]
METVLTLFITCLLITVGTLQVKNYQQKTEETMFLRQFEDDWQNTLNTSFLTHGRNEVDFSSESVSFLSGKKNTVLKIPPTLRSTPKEINVNKTGEISPKTIYFNSEDGKKKYKYTVQMDWGVLIAS